MRSNAVTELLELAATGGCGGRQHGQSLKGLEKFMDYRSIKGVGRNIPSNMFNPITTDGGGI